MDKKISNKFIYFFGSFGGILFGYDIGVMTGALPFLQTDWSLSSSSSLVGWITSAVMFGAIFGGAVHWHNDRIFDSQSHVPYDGRSR